jgi:hypothetical protein
MRATSGALALAAFAILVGQSAPVQADKSRTLHGGSFFTAPGAARIFESAHPSVSHHKHGSGMVFHHRQRRFSRSESFTGAIVPPLSGTIVPPFQIGRSFPRDRFFRHRFDGFFFGGSGGSRQTIIILERIPVVPIADPAGGSAPVKPQIVELQPSERSAAEVQVFTPSTAP